MNRFNCLAIFYACRLQNRQCEGAAGARRTGVGRAVRQRFLDRRWFDVLLAADWLIGLCDDPYDVMFRLEQRFQCRYADLTSGNKNNPHASKSHVINGRDGPPGRPFLRRVLAPASELWSRLTKAAFFG